ncbi:hypothetical protein TRFO_01071 [Tritrichomonas foetus]|uniref:Uncharacterized protein n=1 Tax=Tritrichomonas foetus TaxID=1144522 RepID=A0A1J4KJQ0_9EUKA|nr:hypothetical protein TRFO_01071 [Tritrichomonas foetus]|eukprot:OHT11168.1 hypothetical protein TRFO_01071 [Tritrichomonas foetus]
MNAERRQKSLKALESLNCDVPHDLEYHFTQEETTIRPVEDIIHRASALYCLATYADSLLQGNCPRDEARSFAQKFISRYNADQYFTEKEKEFMENPAPTQEQVGQFCWQWESLYSMLYCLGFIDSLGLPTEACKVPLCSRAFARNRTTDALVKVVKIRPIEEILDFCDLIFCCFNARNKSSFENGVLCGWKKTADWITIVKGKEYDWDSLQ